MTMANDDDEMSVGLLLLVLEDVLVEDTCGFEKGRRKGMGRGTCGLHTHPCAAGPQPQGDPGVAAMEKNKRVPRRKAVAGLS